MMIFAALTLLAAIGVAALGFRDQRALWWRFQAMTRSGCSR
ncbi:hypothetical protein [Saccharopolyspora elongata]|nr:hypothetical protein [Saccharopolyspora elongata]